MFIVLIYTFYVSKTYSGISATTPRAILFKCLYLSKSNKFLTTKPAKVSKLGLIIVIKLVYFIEFVIIVNPLEATFQFFLSQYDY